MNLDQWFKDLIPVTATLIGMVAWFIRLEAKVLANDKSQNDCEKNVDKLDVQLRALDNRIVEKLSFIERSLAKIEGRLSLSNDQNHGG